MPDASGVSVGKRGTKIPKLQYGKSFGTAKIFPMRLLLLLEQKHNIKLEKESRKLM